MNCMSCSEREYQDQSFIQYSEYTQRKNLLFVSTKSLVDLIFERVKEHSDIPCGVIHSNRSKFRF